MAGRWAHGLTGGLAAAGLLIACPLPAPAQDGGGIELGLELSQRLSREDGDSLATTGLGLTLDSRTRASQLSFSARGGVEADLGAGGGSRLSDPRLRLSYSRESRGAALSATLRYRRSDVDTLYEDGELGEGVLVLDQGTRTDYGGDLSLALGRTAPLGAVLDLGYGVRDYSGTSDPSLLDETTRRAGLTLSFRIDPRITAELSAATAQTDRDAPGTDLTRDSLGLGASLAVSPVLSTRVYLGRTRIEERGPLGDSTTEGTALRLSFEHALPRGALTGSLVSDLDEAGRRTTARLNRSIELRDGAFSAGIGLSEGAGAGGTSPLLALAWRRDTPHGALNLRLDQDYATNSDGEEARNSRLSLGYRHELTRLASLEARLGLRDTAYTDAATPDTRRLRLDLVYRHDLTRDWNLVTGYAHTRSRQNGSPQTTSDEIYLGLEKNLRWRF